MFPSRLKLEILYHAEKKGASAFVAEASLGPIRRMCVLELSDFSNSVGALQVILTYPPR